MFFYIKIKKNHFKTSSNKNGCKVIKTSLIYNMNQTLNTSWIKIILFYFLKLNQVLIE